MSKYNNISSNDFNKNSFPGKPECLDPKCATPSNITPFKTFDMNNSTCQFVECKQIIDLSGANQLGLKNNIDINLAMKCGINPDVITKHNTSSTNITNGPSLEVKDRIGVINTPTGSTSNTTEKIPSKTVNKPIVDPIITPNTKFSSSMTINIIIIFMFIIAIAISISLYLYYRTQPITFNTNNELFTTYP
jgi:hypothetical protein